VPPPQAGETTVDGDMVAPVGGLMIRHCSNSLFVMANKGAGPVPDDLRIFFRVVERSEF